MPAHEDTLKIIANLLDSMGGKQPAYSTFSAKIKVIYENEKGKQPDFTAHVRMQKDSVIWLSLGNDIGIEGFRVLIDRDSITILDKLANTYQKRPLSSLQEISQLPFSLSDLQNLLIGLPVFFDRTQIYSYSNNRSGFEFLSNGPVFRNLLSIGANYQLEKSKLDDVNPVLNRTATLSYQEYEEKEGFRFSTYRECFISTKGVLSIQLKFKDYRFNELLNFPFTIPKKFKRVN